MRELLHADVQITPHDLKHADTTANKLIWYQNMKHDSNFQNQSCLLHILLSRFTTLSLCNQKEQN